ncbi:MAG: alpha/beta fold hydrolase [Acidobacteria bacterium]|nr:alpha/beta fold hydrolase [Acidobacteriota bacterium]
MPKSDELTRRNFLSLCAGAGAGLAFGKAKAQTRPDLLAIKTRADWQRARKQILDGMQLLMGKLPVGKREKVKFSEIEKEELPAFTRTKIRYLVERDDWVSAYLLVPKNLKRRTAAMLCLHQTIKIGKAEPAGLGGSANLQYAKELAERGYVCIVPDYPYLGENNFDPYKNGYVSCTMKGIVNHMRAVDLLQSLPMVDSKRIGSIGHSLGGHNTLFVAAFDPRIKAMVTSCGFTAAKKYYNGDLTGWAGVRYMPLIAEKYGKDPARIPFDFPELLVALAPRPLFVNAPLHDSNFEVSGVKDCVEAAMPVYDKIFKAKDRLVAAYPDAGHDFPAEIRQQVWQFLDRWLKS